MQTMRGGTRLSMYVCIFLCFAEDAQRVFVELI